MTPEQFESWQHIEYWRDVDRESKLIEGIRASLARVEAERFADSVASLCTFTAKDIEFLKQMKIVLP